MADNLECFVGGTFQWSHILDWPVAVTIGSVTCTIVDVTDPTTPLVDEAAGSSADYDEDDAGANAKRVFYTWAVPADPLEAQYYLTVTFTPSGGTAITKTFDGTIEVWPKGSYLDRYINFIKDLLQESEVGDAQAELGRRDYRRALQTALAAYNADVEPDTDATLSHTADTLTAGHFESVCWYAGAIALLGPQAVAYLRTATPEIAAQFVNREPRSASAVAIAKEWLKRAQELWASYGGAGGVQTGTLSLDVTELAPYQVWREDLADWLGAS